MIARSHFGIILLTLILPFLPLSAWSKSKCGAVVGGPLNGKANVEWAHTQQRITIRLYSLLPVDRQSLDFEVTNKTFNNMNLDGNQQNLPKVDSSVVSTYSPTKPQIFVFDDAKPEKVSSSSLKKLGILPDRNWQASGFVYKAKDNELYNVVTNKRTSWGQPICVWAKPHGKNKIIIGKKEYWLLYPSRLTAPFMKLRNQRTRKMSGVVLEFEYNGPVNLNTIDAIPGFTFE